MFTGHDSHGGLYHLDICWKDDRAGHKQSRFLECIDNNILTQVVEGPTRKYVPLNIVLESNEELIIDVKAGGCLGSSDHKIVEFRILRGGSEGKSRTTALDFRRADVNLFRDLIGRIIWDISLEGRVI